MEKKAILGYMRDSAEYHRDDCGDINMTTLAEDAYSALVSEESQEFEIPEIYFESAFEISEELE